MQTWFEDEGRRDVAHALLLLQGAIGLLSGVAMLIFMGGSPLAWPLGIGVPLFLFVVAEGVVRRWRWARKAAVIVQWLILVAFVLSLLIGMLEQVGVSINLMSLITNVVVPVTLIRLLRQSKAAAVASVEPVPIASVASAA